jgi:hypothetical protein
MGHPTLDNQAEAGAHPGDGDDEGDGPRQPEKRRHRRVELGVRCWLTNDRHTVYLRLHDVSMGGLSVRAPVPFAPSGLVEVGLELPGGRKVRARGEIVWVRQRAPEASTLGPLMGARFVEFTEGEAELNTLLGHA